MEIRKPIRQFILGNYLFSSDEAALQDDTSLIAQGTIDSTGVLELIMHIEEQFGITVQDQEMLPENLDSVNRIVAFIERKRAVAE
jgi:acyl carrier protein